MRGAFVCHLRPRLVEVGSEIFPGGLPEGWSSSVRRSCSDPGSLCRRLISTANDSGHKVQVELACFVLCAWRGGCLVARSEEHFMFLALVLAYKLAKEPRPQGRHKMDTEQWWTFRKLGSPVKTLKSMGFLERRQTGCRLS
eukprot:5631587-Amphidinium_carterae.2